MTVSKSFTAVGSSLNLFVKFLAKLDYSVSGTFVGTVVIERSIDGGLTWLSTGVSATDTASGVIVNENSGSSDALYRIRCTAYTSGTIVTTLKNTAPVSGGKTRWATALFSAITAGTSTTPSATTCYLSQVEIRRDCRLTGIAIANAATVGTDKLIAVLFDENGKVVAYSALAGTTTSGADAYQSLDFTDIIDVKAGLYWIGLYVNGTTDRFRTIPAAGAGNGLSGSVTGQTFGTVVDVTPPTTFTADKGPLAFTY